MIRRGHRCSPPLPDRGTAWRRTDEPASLNGMSQRTPLVRRRYVDLLRVAAGVCRAGC